MANLITNIATAIDAAQPLFNQYSGMHFLPCQTSGHKDDDAYLDSRRGARGMDEIRQRQNYKLHLERLGREAEFEGQIAAKRRDVQQKVFDEEDKFRDALVEKHAELTIALDRSAAQLKDTMENGPLQGQQAVERYAAHRQQKSHRLATEAAAKSRSKLEKEFVKRQGKLQKEAKKGKIDKAMFQLRTAQLQGDIARSLQQQQTRLETEHMERAARDAAKISALEGEAQKQLRDKQVAQLKELRLTQAHFKSVELRLGDVGYAMPPLLGPPSTPTPQSQQYLEQSSSSARPHSQSTNSTVPPPPPQTILPATSVQDVSVTQVLGGLACLTGRALNLAGSALLQISAGAGQQNDVLGQTGNQTMPGSFE